MWNKDEMPEIPQPLVSLSISIFQPDVTIEGGSLSGFRGTERSCKQVGLSGLVSPALIV